MLKHKVLFIGKKELIHTFREFERFAKSTGHRECVVRCCVANWQRWLRDVLVS